MGFNEELMRIQWNFNGISQGWLGFNETYDGFPLVI